MTGGCLFGTRPRAIREEEGRAVRPHESMLAQLCHLMANGKTSQVHAWNLSFFRDSGVFFQAGKGAIARVSFLPVAFIVRRIASNSRGATTETGYKGTGSRLRDREIFSDRSRAATSFAPGAQEKSLYSPVHWRSCGNNLCLALPQTAGCKAVRGSFVKKKSVPFFDSIVPDR